MDLLEKKDKIFVAGSNGMVGSAICRLLNKKGYNNTKKNLLTPSRYELDLTNLNNVEKAKDIFLKILEEEKLNKIPDEIYEKGIKKFDEKFNKVNWNKHHIDLPFNDSSLALYEWSPIAEELKELDKKIVLNSMILKWDNVKKEFLNLLNF